MKVIIVDDERNALENLQTKIKKISQITSIMIFADPFEAIHYAVENPIDIAFLDIEMAGINGIEMARRLKDINKLINIIFITAHVQYVLEAFGLHASNYILKPAKVELIRDAIGNLRYPIQFSHAHIWVQTFGSFEIFVDGCPLQISRSKVKELLACLVDKRGVPMTASQAAAALWADKEYNRSVQKQMQTVISQMMKTLREAGIANIVVKGWNNLAVDISKFECDYYQFLRGNLNAVNAYAGEYMREYGWAEMTADMLTHRQ